MMKAVRLPKWENFNPSKISYLVSSPQCYKKFRGENLEGEISPAI